MESKFIFSFIYSLTGEESSTDVECVSGKHRKWSQVPSLSIVQRVDVSRM